MTEIPVSRGEFTMLVNQVNANVSRMDSIDQGGTRGIGVVHSQLTDLAKDVAALSARMDMHEREHVQEAKERKAVRWRLVSLIVVLFSAIETPLFYMLFQRR